MKWYFNLKTLWHRLHGDNYYRRSFFYSRLNNVDTQMFFMTMNGQRPIIYTYTKRADEFFYRKSAVHICWDRDHADEIWTREMKRVLGVK